MKKRVKLLVYFGTVMFVFPENCYQKSNDILLKLPDVINNIL